MVLDTSAIIAILQQEPPAARLTAVMDADSTRLVSSATVVEASLVLLGRYGDAGEAQLDRFLRKTGAEVVPVGEEHVVLARDAAARFGRGRHAAALNFGDCFSYALATVRREPLLFVGSDFDKTDVECCAW
ncbi:MAG: type II toxin-antitoxin system VapC family toxin [Gemmatimonadales bacterium]